MAFSYDAALVPLRHTSGGRLRVCPMIAVIVYAI
jgi:hypothetical protein